MRIKQVDTNKYRKQYFWEEHDMLCSSIVAIVITAAFMAALFI